MPKDTRQSTILVVDDDPSILEVLEARLASAGFGVVTAPRAEEGLGRLENQAIDLVITDVRMPGMGGKGLLAQVAGRWPGLPVIMLTAYGAIPDAVESIKTGAAEYLTKPFDGKELLAKVEALTGTAPRPKAAKRTELSEIGRVIWGGQGPAMRTLFDMMERIAPSDINVLILGESGTGKELVARTLHRRSNHADGPYVIVDCGSTPAGLLESELFGHIKGSFTHAVRDKKGLIEEARDGTLFLDEIGNISAEMQTRLLRFLQEHTIRRIGDTKEIPVSCRVLSATHADLPAMVRAGEFREDLYYRLKGVTLAIPALRERKEDIPLLVERFTTQAAESQGRPVPAIPQETMDYLLAHSWPGNVRELKQSLEAGVVLCRDNVLRPTDLQLEDLRGPDAPAGKDGLLSLDESEHQAILRALKKANWVQTAAADLLGISRRAIHYKIKKYGIQIPGKSER